MTGEDAEVVSRKGGMFGCFAASPQRPRRVPQILPQTVSSTIQPYTSRIPDIVADLRATLAPSPLQSPTPAAVADEDLSDNGDVPQPKSKARAQRRR